MSDLIIKNIQQIVSGNFNAPLLDGDTLLVRAGKIEWIGAYASQVSKMR